MTRIHEDYIKGVLTIDNRLILLLDLAKVLSEEDLERYTEISRSHRIDTKAQSLKPGNNNPPYHPLQKSKQAKLADKPVERQAPKKGKVKRK